MVFCINAVVADHFKVPVRDIYDQFDEVNAGDAFRDRFMILMALIMERHGIPVIGINPGSGNEKCFTCMSAAWKMASGPWSLSTTCNSRKKTHRPDPSWNGRCICLMTIAFRVCFYPHNPPGVRHCTIAPVWLSISIPLRFPYWNLTCIWIPKGQTCHAWVARRHPIFPTSRILPPGASKYCWKWENCRVAKPKFVMLDAPVFWIPFSRIPEKLIPPAKDNFAKTKTAHTAIPRWKSSVKKSSVKNCGSSRQKWNGSSMSRKSLAARM